jgi:hypothetical protein
VQTNYHSHITFKQNKIIQIITCYFFKKSQHTTNVGIGLHYQALFVEDKKNITNVLHKMEKKIAKNKINITNK